MNTLLLYRDFLFSGSEDKEIKVSYDCQYLEDMLPIQSLQRHDGSVNTLLLYGDFLFSGSEDKEIKVSYDCQYLENMLPIQSLQ